MQQKISFTETIFGLFAKRFISVLFILQYNLNTIKLLLTAINKVKPQAMITLNNGSLIILDYCFSVTESLL